MERVENINMHPNSHLVPAQTISSPMKHLTLTDG